MRNRVAIVAAGLVGAFALYQAEAWNAQPDLFIYRQGTAIALRGESPYEPAKIRAAVNEQFPNPNAGPDDFQNNCGFFLPPAAALWYAPLAAVPWREAKWIWAVLCGLAALGVTRLAWTSRSRERPESAVSGTPDSHATGSTAFDHVVPFLLVVNFLTFAIVQVGQTTLVTVGCVAFGLVCFEKKRPLAGTILWSVAFVKPHIALPLIPLAWFLGGWKRAAGLVLIVGFENVIGAMIAGGTPLFLVEYLEFLAAGHKAVAFNLAERNYEITSWNRLLFVFTGHVVEQTATITLAGDLIGFGLVVGRCAVANARPGVAWALAAAGTASAFIPQALGYEVLILALAVPWVREASANGYRLVGGLGMALLVAQLIPFGTFANLGVTFHRPLAVAAFALLVLAGPVNFTHVPASVQPPASDR